MTVDSTAGLLCYQTAVLPETVAISSMTQIRASFPLSCHAWQFATKTDTYTVDKLPDQQTGTELQIKTICAAD